MYKTARSHFLFPMLMLMLGAPSLVCAQSQLRFSVVPGDESGQIGVGTTNTEFRFSVNAAGALCYQVDFDDNNRTPSTPPAADGRAVHTHGYTRPGRYSAVMRVWWPGADDVQRTLDCSTELGRLPDPIELTLQILVRPPSPVPRPARPAAIFSVTPSTAVDSAGDGLDATWGDFTFTAFVTGARRYQINFDDGIVETDLVPRSVSEGIVRRHRYAAPGVYLTVLTARSDSGELVELVRQVTVQEPAAIAPVQWPPAGRTSAVPAKPAESNLLTWLLLLAVILATLRFGGSGPIQANPVIFEATRDRGRSAVAAGKTASDAVSFRVRNDKPKFVISKEAIMLGVRPHSKSR